VNSSTVNKHYVVWVKTHCPWCTKATELLTQKALSHTVFAMDNCPEILVAAKKNFDWETVPIVLEVTSDGAYKFIGGYTNLEEYLEDVNDSVQITLGERMGSDSLPEQDQQD
jgi:glutaredoxin